MNLHYFIGIPFVLGDEGVRLAMDGRMDFEGRTYDLVRVTFAPGTGDAPDDYALSMMSKAMGMREGTTAKGRASLPRIMPVVYAS